MFFTDTSWYLCMYYFQVCYIQFNPIQIDFISDEIHESLTTCHGDGMVSPTAMKVMKFRKPLICHGQSMKIGTVNRNFHNSLGIFMGMNLTTHQTPIKVNPMEPQEIEFMRFSVVLKIIKIFNRNFMIFSGVFHFMG